MSAEAAIVTMERPGVGPENTARLARRVISTEPLRRMHHSGVTPHETVTKGRTW